MFFHPEQIIMPVLHFEDSLPTMEEQYVEKQYASYSREIEREESEKPQPEFGFTAAWQSPSLWILCTLTVCGALYGYVLKNREYTAIRRFQMQGTPTRTVNGTVANLNEEMLEKQKQNMYGQELLKKHGLSTVF
eukprot:GHVP01027209.1.p2 GENE.GHVP01027209.1~~GHVP01027209.1.p2  ORF type:complete len:134 (-),score=19.03 GHVP01027209.1:481-882(-)